VWDWEKWRGGAGGKVKTRTQGVKGGEGGGRWVGVTRQGGRQDEGKGMGTITNNEQGG